MTRKGPKKTTTRDGRDYEREKMKSLKSQDELKLKKTLELCTKYDNSSRPVMPESKAERRSLRLGLQLRSEKLERIGGEPDLNLIQPSESYGHTARGTIRIEMSVDDYYDIDT